MALESPSLINLNVSQESYVENENALIRLTILTLGCYSLLEMINVIEHEWDRVISVALTRKGSI